VNLPRAGRRPRNGRTRPIPSRPVCLYTPIVDICATYRRFETPHKESLSHWGGDYTISPGQEHGRRVARVSPATANLA
jgi:hypothetical protein